MSARPVALRAYLAASCLADPLARLWLRRRAGRGREDPARLAERFGRAAAPRPAGPLVWLHGASVGEALSLMPLVRRLTAGAAACLVTTGTVTGARRVAPLLPPGARHQFAPIDTRAATRAFLHHWRPDLAVWVESEFWPRLMVETAARGVPMLLVNARVSAASARGWARVPTTAAALLGLFERIWTQDPETAERLLALGAAPGRVRVAGNLKALAPPEPVSEAALGPLRAALAGRVRWLAASTHAPEEALAAAAHRGLARALPGLLTMIAPRHPERASAIAAALAGQGLAVTRRSHGQGPAGDVWLLDTMGEMGLWYRLAPVAFVGGSLAPRGGHNPFEPAALGCAILHGPSTENFAPAYGALAMAGGARPVADGPTLTEALAELLGPAGDASRRALVRAATAVEAGARADLAAVLDEMQGVAGDLLARGRDA